MGPQTFRVKWTELHEVLLGADDEDEAIERAAIYQGIQDTCLTVDTISIEGMGPDYD